MTFKDVHFLYPTRPNLPVLRGLGLIAKPSQYVAMIGDSRYGKSTTYSNASITLSRAASVPMKRISCA